MSKHMHTIMYKLYNFFKKYLKMRMKAFLEGLWGKTPGSQWRAPELDPWLGKVDPTWVLHLRVLLPQLRSSCAAVKTP